MPHPTQGNPPTNSLLRMRPDQTEEKVALAKKLLDPNYILKTLRQSSEKSLLDRQLQQALKTIRPKSPLVPRPALHPRHPEPAVKPGSGGDLLEALMAVPTLKSGIDKLKAAVIAKPIQDWKRLSSGGKAAVISQTVLMGGGALTAVLSSKQDRQSLYNMLKDREIPIPVPGVPGLEVQLQTGKEHKAMLLFNLTKFWQSK